MKKLEIELATFEKNRDRFVATSEGKYVLIHRREIVGFYESEWDAIDEGYRRFGNVPFLVKQITRLDLPIVLTSNLIAV